MHLEKISDSTKLLRNSNHLRAILIFLEASWLDNWIRWTIRAEIIGNYNQTIKTRARGLRCSDTACAMFPQPATGDCVGGGGRERRVSRAELGDQCESDHVPLSTLQSHVRTLTSEMVTHKIYLLTILCSLSLAQSTTLADFLYQRLRKANKFYICFKKIATSL